MRSDSVSSSPSPNTTSSLPPPPSDFRTAVIKNHWVIKLVIKKSIRN
jgi:hypothetical protein